ncbi:uncharacterized protein LOC143199936 isoform X1 [Rhynchophorus ferrugineus]|uniref:uncharacterized protein LOC143199936 isoform X1 n=2 Tax=Rhynchophorus ferrugineus TaxID=354439 RepID=UPI003FCC45A9
MKQYQYFKAFGGVTIYTLACFTIVLIFIPIVLLDVNNKIAQSIFSWNNYTIANKNGTATIDTQPSHANATNLNVKIHSKLETSSFCVYTDTCKIECTGGNLDQVIEDINNVASTITDCFSLYAIDLSQTIFESNTINKGWLQKLTIMPNSLRVAVTDLKELGDEAFSGHPFNNNPIDLVLMETKIEYLRRNSFVGSSLASFTFDMYTLVSGLEIEDDVFNSTDYSIQYISFTYSLNNVKAVRSLMGRYSYFTKLEALYLRYNSLVVLENNLFSNAPNLLALYLSYSGVREINEETFNGLDILQLLDISSNNLKTLPRKAFDTFSISTRVNGKSNPWECDCELVWFKQFLLNRNSEFWPECRVDYSWEDMETYEFCPDFSSTLPSSTIRSSTVLPSTSKPSDSRDYIIRAIVCQNSENIDNNSDASRLDSSRKLVQQAILKRRNINYVITRIETNSFQYSMNLSGDLKTTDSFVWMNVDNASDYGCVYDITGTIQMTLSPKSTYTLCVAANEHDEDVSLVIEDCTALSTPSEWPEQTWLNNKQKTLFIGITVTTFLIGILISIIVTYYINKNLSKMFRRKKQTKKMRDDFINTLPRPKETTESNRYSDRKSSDQSLTTNVDGYLTPVLKEGWLYSTRYEEMDYVKRIMEKKYSKVYEAPPLPPNHPSEMKRQPK